jgi:hypothetical protein
MKKDLESIYQEAFNSSQIDAEDWNLPSEIVWENVEEAIQPKQRRRIIWFWLPTLCLLMGIVGLQILPNRNKHNSLKPQAATIANIQNNNDSSTNSTNYDKLSSTYESEKKVASNAEEKEKKASTTNKSSKKKTSMSFNASNDESFVAQTVLPSAASKVVTNEAIKERINDEKLLKDTISLCSTLPILSLHDFDLKNNNPNLNIQKQLIQPLKTNSFQLFWNVYMLNIKNKTSTGAANTTDFSGESLKYAYQTGFTLRKNIRKNFFFEFGAQYHELQYQLKYEIGLPFNGIGETTNNKGNFDNIYNGAVTTSIGELKMQMVLERQLGHSVPQGEIIPLSAEGEARLGFLRLPIAFGFRKNISPRFSLSGKGIFIQNINIIHKAQFQQVLSHHTAVKETLTEVVASPTPNVWTPELGFGLDLEYRLTPKWSVKADVIGIKSIRHIYQNDIFTNSPKYVGGGIGLGYRF